MLVHSGAMSVETNRSALICQLFLSYHFNQPADIVDKACKSFVEGN